VISTPWSVSTTGVDLVGGTDAAWEMLVGTSASEVASKVARIMAVGKVGGFAVGMGAPGGAPW
jgi:hypothetical protein